MSKSTCNIMTALAVVASAALADRACGAVAVGSSLLINRLQYSDTFTETQYGGLPNRNDGVGPSGAGLSIENTYGNPAQSWSAGMFAFVTNQSAAAGFPGDSGAGSATGMAQGHGAEYDFGFGYGLSRDFFVQMDAVNPYVFNIFIGSTPNSFSSADGLGIAFTSAGAINVMGAGYSPYITYTTMSPIPTNTWNNYGVEFNLNSKLVNVYFNQRSVASIDLNTWPFGHYFTNALDAATANSVNVGLIGPGFNPAYFWVDNFQVGIPEPSTVTLLSIAGLLLARRWRK